MLGEDDSLEALPPELQVLEASTDLDLDSVPIEVDERLMPQELLAAEQVYRSGNIETGTIQPDGLLPTALLEMEAAYQRGDVNPLSVSEESLLRGDRM